MGPMRPWNHTSQESATPETIPGFSGAWIKYANIFRVEVPVIVEFAPGHCSGIFVVERLTFHIDLGFLSDGNQRKTETMTIWKASGVWTYEIHLGGEDLPTSSSKTMSRVLFRDTPRQCYIDLAHNFVADVIALLSLVYECTTFDCRGEVNLVTDGYRGHGIRHFVHVLVVTFLVSDHLIVRFTGESGELAPVVELVLVLIAEGDDGCPAVRHAVILSVCVYDL